MAKLAALLASVLVYVVCIQVCSGTVVLQGLGSDIKCGIHNIFGGRRGAACGVTTSTQAPVQPYPGGNEQGWGPGNGQGWGQGHRPTWWHQRPGANRWHGRPGNSQGWRPASPSGNQGVDMNGGNNGPNTPDWNGGSQIPFPNGNDGNPTRPNVGDNNPQVPPNGGIVQTSPQPVVTISTTVTPLKATNETVNIPNGSITTVNPVDQMLNSKLTLSDYDIVQLEGETKSITCKHDGGLRITWILPSGAALKPGSRPAIINDIPGSSTIGFQKLAPLDSGTYACTTGLQQVKFTLKVTPSIDEMPPVTTTLKPGRRILATGSNCPEGMQYDGVKYCRDAY